MFIVEILHEFIWIETVLGNWLYLFHVLFVFLIEFYTCSSLFCGFRFFLFRRWIVGLLIACRNDYAKAVICYLFCICYVTTFRTINMLFYGNWYFFITHAAYINGLFIRFLFVFLTMKIKGNHY